jgi:hypothetical protein
LWHPPGDFVQIGPVFIPPPSQELFLFVNDHKMIKGEEIEEDEWGEPD